MSVDENAERKAKELNAEEEKFENYYKAQSEAVRIEFRRRYDQAIAVIWPAKKIWACIDELTQRQETAGSHPWRKVEPVLFFGGLLLGAWQSPEGKTSFNIGYQMSMLGAASYLWHVASNFLIRRDLNKLNERQDDYSYEWQVSGAEAGLFYRYRDRARDELKLLWLADPERRAATEELETDGQWLSLRLRASLLDSIAGDHYLMRGSWKW